MSSWDYNVTTDACTAHDAHGGTVDKLQTSYGLPRLIRRAWSHERSPTGKYEWLTPPDIIRALGSFDLDPCAPERRPWSTARCHYTIQDDGLRQAWFGRVWLNPPYGPETHKWLARLAQHGNGIALIFARTETRMFFDYIWEQAHAVLFLRGRLTFYNLDGTKPKNSGGAPSCLVAYGLDNVAALGASGLAGKLVRLSLNGRKET